MACCLDALFNIGAFMFLFGPRKYFRGAFVNGWKRMLAALLYWTLIALTVALAFIPGVTKWELLAALVAMKIAWAVNLAAAPVLPGPDSDGDAAASAAGADVQLLRQRRPGGHAGVSAAESCERASFALACSA